MKTILIPVFNKRISSRLDCTENFQLIKVDNDSVKSIETVKHLAKNQLDELNFILSIKPDTIICNGITDFYTNEFSKNRISVIPWVHGQLEEVVQNFLTGKLAIKNY